MDTILLVIVLIPVVGAAVVVGITFPLSWWVFPGGGSRGPHDTMTSRVLGVILVVVAEWFATVWMMITVPFRFLRPAAPGRRLAEGRVPVVLLPGFFENAATMVWLHKRLERSLGVPVRTLQPRRYLAGLETLGRDYQAQIESWMRESGASQVDLVGHSMGGLLARALVETGPMAGKVRSVVTIGAPHQGSAIALLGAALRSMRQMRRGSAYLERLNNAPAPQDVRMVGISSTHDNYVLPWNCALSPRGDNFIIRYRGHLTLILSGEVVRLISRTSRGP